jgi:branched-subunit amino acid aminotransferase/4-amino-4-deoxychorismate lyase
MHYNASMKTNLTCFLNGNFIANDDAFISANDRGFRFGTIAVCAGVPYQWGFHLQRLQLGLDAFGIEFETDTLQAHGKTLLQRNNIQAGFLRIAISRGVGSRGYAPHELTAPTCFMQCLPPAPPAASMLRLHLSDIRKIPPECLPANLKTAQSMNSVLALLDAQRHGADEAVQLSIDGLVSEASSGNLFWVKNNVIYTPSLATHCVAGSTRNALLRLHDITEVETNAEALQTADTIALSNVRYGLIPCTFQPHQASHKHWEMLANLLAADRADYATSHQHFWR